MIVLIDNYDSFTYNLYQYLKEISNKEVCVVRNDEATVTDILNMNPSHIIISPGPGRPEQAGITVALIRKAAGHIPILGVCLGMQAIAVAFGMKIMRSQHIVHGKTDQVEHDGKGIFRSIASPATYTRYHSLAIDPSNISKEFEISARSPDDEIMGMRHMSHIIEGVQFHPESVASKEGKKLLGNFLHYRREAFIPRNTLNKLLAGSSLEQEEAQRWMEEVTVENLSPVLLSAFLTAFRIKKPTDQELAGVATAFLNHARHTPLNGKLLDTCGTGGDQQDTFNISSITALMAAACGARVAKHGNRAVSSQCGSADFYQALGIPLELEPQDAATLLEKTNFTFLFAPLYHPRIKLSGQVRRELGIKTIMNLLGPLVHPAQASHRIVGVYDGDTTNIMAKAAKLLKVTQAFFFHADDGQDEVSVTAATRGFMLHPNGEIMPMNINPKEYQIPTYSIRDLRGGRASENAKEAWNIARGRGKKGIRDAMILNTACALFIYDAVESIQDGVDKVREELAAGKLEQKMEEIIDTTKTLPSQLDKNNPAKVTIT